MQFKDYYATLGLPSSATPEEIKRAYRKLARKYHPDVSKEPDAEARFKDVAEAHEALIDPERRAAYDAIAQRHARGQAFEPPPGWEAGFEFSGRGDAGGGGDYSDFFETLFGRARAGAAARPRPGGDHHAKVQIELRDAYLGARRTIALRVPVIDAAGRATLQERQLEVQIPPGVRPGQHLRLAGQGAAGQGGAAAGDLYLELQFSPHPVFRVEGRDVYFELPVAPWEAALGASVTVPTPSGSVQLAVPPASSPGRKLRLKGKGLPGQPPGDLYAVLAIALPPADTPEAEAAYRALAQASAGWDPRSALAG
ncbi:MAG: DnaJ domain-containing protein [Burkholderiales bacterium]|nr:DnaJ domain-containing protein [Burkholderiales bacterium]